MQFQNQLRAPNSEAFSLAHILQRLKWRSDLNLIHCDFQIIKLKKIRDGGKTVTPNKKNYLIAPIRISC